VQEVIINYILICILCYITGSIPTAYILVKRRYNKDIRLEGTGNVGAMNSFEVTGSGKAGIFIFLIDFLKGLIPVLILTGVNKLSFALLILPSVLLIAGHNYSIFLKFKGGRGLSTAMGVMFTVNILMILFWLIFYFIAHKIKSNVHLASIAASILYVLPLVFFPGFVNRFTLNNSVTNDQNFLLFTFCASISILILLKHIDPLQDLLNNKNEK
jgi:Predicted membrane protein